MFTDYTPLQLEKAEKRLEAEASSLCHWFIENGFGNYRRSELRNIYASQTLTEEQGAKFKRSFEVDELQMRLYREMERRRTYHGSLRRTPKQTA